MASFTGYRVHHNSTHGPDKNGVIVSYFKCIQDVQCYFWCEKEVNAELQHILDLSYENVYSFAKEKRYNLRTIAILLAIKKLANTLEVRGIYP